MAPQRFRLRRIEADLILPLDGSDGRSGAARSLDIADGRIVAIDAPSPADLRPQERLDLRHHRGATVIPGLIDAHLHLLMGGLSLTQLTLADASSREDFEARLDEHARSLETEEWLIGWGWSEENWDDHELPDRSWLASVGDRPTLLWRMDHHACVVNDAVLAMIGDVDDPAGGTIVRDARGRPTGLLLEAAAWRLGNPLVPNPSGARRRESLRAAMQLLNRHGIVACGAMEYADDLRDVFDPLREAFSLRVAATVLDREWPLDLALADVVASDDWLRIIGFKAFVDGTLGSRTAAMLEAYADDPDNDGTLVELAERGVLREWMQAVADRGLSPSTHAIGDRALRLVLDAADAVEAAGRSLSAGKAPTALRVEHAQTIHPADLPRMRHRWASMQPQHRADDGRSVERRLGAARMERFFPFRRLLDHGARLAFGSDWPIVRPDPIAGLHAAITARDLDGRIVEADQALRPLEALHAYTRGAAACLGLPNGRIAVGAPADLTVLSSDPLAFDWKGCASATFEGAVDDRGVRVDAPRPIRTIVDGMLVSHADSHADG